MKKSFILVTFFCCIFFLSGVFFSLKLYKETKSFLKTHENLLLLEEQLDQITVGIDRQVNSLFIQKKLLLKTPVELNLDDVRKKIEDIRNVFNEKFEYYGCADCHKRSESHIKTLSETLEKMRIKSDNILKLSFQYLSDETKSQEILNEKIYFERLSQTVRDSLKIMESSYHDNLLKKITIYPLFYSFYSLVALIFIITIATILYRNFLKDFFKLSRLCKDYEENNIIDDIEVRDFKSRETRMLGEIISETLKKLQENEQELEQQFEEIKGMNEELQASNQQLELLTAELEDTKRDLEKRVEEKTRQLEKAYEELKDLDRMKSNFLQSISHEFKTPLTPLFGYIKLFKNKELGELTPLQEQSIDIMLTCAEKLYNTIEDLIFLARLNLEKERYMLRDIDLTYLIKNIIGRVEKELDEKKIKVNLNIPDFSIVIKGEQLMLSQTILHLIRNAIKYTPDKGEIMLVLSMEDKNAVLRIIDTGSGMPQNVLNAINTYLTKDDFETNLKGDFITLGLNILKRVVVFHNAKVYYKSKKDIGTEVGIIFPIKF